MFGQAVPDWLELMIDRLSPVTTQSHRGRGYAGCGWHEDLSSQSLSEPTADEPFRFLLGALGLESSSSWRGVNRSH